MPCSGFIPRPVVPLGSERHPGSCEPASIAEKSTRNAEEPKYSVIRIRQAMKSDSAAVVSHGMHVDGGAGEGGTQRRPLRG